jgi:hypothetical protein
MVNLNFEQETVKRTKNAFFFLRELARVVNKELCNSTT